MEALKSRNHYRLVETINGAPCEPCETVNSTMGVAQSDERAAAFLTARMGYWQTQGFFMLHVDGTLVVTGYHEHTGECLVLTFEAVADNEKAT